MKVKTAFYLIISLIFIFLIGSNTSFSSVIRREDKTFIVDQTGERWDVSQAQPIGFNPDNFQFGIGRNAFIPLDDLDLTEDRSSISKGSRVIGVMVGRIAHAYSVSRLRHHEIANTHIGSKPIMVGY
jgi:hypothetical protein